MKITEKKLKHGTKRKRESPEDDEDQCIERDLLKIRDIIQYKIGIGQNQNYKLAENNHHRPKNSSPYRNRQP